MEAIRSSDDLAGRTWWEGDYSISTSSSSSSLIDGRTRKENNNVGSPPSSSGGIFSASSSNLIEMVPFVESLMDQRGSPYRSLPRYTSLVCAPSPTRKAVESPSRRLLKTAGSRRGGDLMECVPWDDEEIARNHEFYLEDIPMLSLSTKHQQVNDKFVNKVELLPLHSQIEELEKKLREKDALLLSSIESEELYKLQADVDRMNAEISKKEDEIRGARTQLAAKQDELLSLCSLMKQIEAHADKSIAKAARAEMEANGLRKQIAALHCKIDNLDSYEIGSFKASTSAKFTSLKSSIKGKKRVSSQNHCTEEKEIERAKKMYSAAIIVARQFPNEATFLMLVEFRSQLYSYSSRRSISSPPNKVLLQPSI